VEQQYLPDAIRDAVFFEASEQGTEEKMKQNQQRRRKAGRSE
jgi:putative ATPase